MESSIRGIARGSVAGTPVDAAAYWILVFARMTPESWGAPYRFYFSEIGSTLACSNERRTRCKALKGSFDAFNDAKARQVLSAFAVDTALVLAHIEIDEKTNEIPAVQKLLEELDVAGHIVTLDAMHCQKNIRNRRRSAGAFDRSIKRQPADLVPQGRGCLQ
jgi:hypothetical protein